MVSSMTSEKRKSKGLGSEATMEATMEKPMQLPAFVAVGFFIIVHGFATFPFKALATRLEYSSDKFSIFTDGPALGATRESLSRSLFPKDFIFGAGTSAYQIEGAASEGGRGVSIWDVWSKIPGKTHNGETGHVAADQYHRYEEDLDLLAAMNMDSYRFSIAWTRIFPNGTGPQVNMEGVSHYNRVIDAALARGIIPLVTLFHWDYPQALQDSYGGWISPHSVGDFASYSEACFAAFGDRVKHWTTFNEPANFLNGYGGHGYVPPGRTANSGTEPYKVTHNVLLAHAAAVDVYRRLYKAEQGGVIGITIDGFWGEPMTNSTKDVDAAERFRIFELAWYLDPLYFGHYPDIIQKNVGDRLPQFTEEQASKLKGSLDFIGINHYTSRWITEGPGPSPNQESSPSLDREAISAQFKDGQEIGPQAASDWLRAVPWGIHNELKWISERYNAPIWVTENGMDYKKDLPLEASLHDTSRIQFFQDYLSAVLQAVREGVDVRAYFAWSFLDTFEWQSGYDLRFGLIYVDYDDGLKRIPKDSSRWFAQMLDRREPNSRMA